MATLYWGGGTGTWDGTTTTNWYSDLARTTLAGVVPTTADDVVFDSASSAAAYTVTLSGTPVCRSWTMSGPATGNVTVAGTVTINVYGDLTWTSTGITASHTGIIQFPALSGNYTVTFSSVSLNCSVYFGLTTGGQSTATWTLGSAMVGTGGLKYFFFNNGTFNTNNFNISTSGRLDSSSVVYLRTVNFGTSLITLSSNGNALFDLSPTNLTFNATSSTIFITSNGSGVQMRVFGGITYGTIRLSAQTNSATSTGKIIYSGSGVCTINTLELVTETTRTWARAFSIGAGTYTIGSIVTTSPPTNPFHRVQILGIPANSNINPYSPTSPIVTLNVGSIDVNDNFDFRGIAAGGAATWSSSLWGDLGGNSGITFASPKTVYLITTGSSGFFGSNSWATSSGGTPSTANYPLPQDSIVIDDNSAASGASISVGSFSAAWQPQITNIDLSQRTLPLTLSWANGLHISGNIIGSSAITSPSNSTVRMVGTGTSTLTCNGQTFTFFEFSKSAGSVVQLGSAYTASATLAIFGGSFNTNNYNVTTGGLTSTTNYSAITFNTGTSVITSTAAYLFTFGSYTFTYSNDTKYVLAPTGTAAPSITYGNSGSPINAKFYIAGSGTGAITISTPSTTSQIISYLEIVRRNAVINITTGKTMRFAAIKIASNIGNRTVFKSTTTAIATVDYTGAGTVDLDYIDVQYLTASAANKWYAGRNSTSTGTTTNWVFGSYSKAPQRANSFVFFP